MTTALLLIDTQANMFDPATPVAGAVPLLVRLHELQKRARAAHAPVVFVRNNGGAGEPDEPGTPGWEVQTVLHPAPGELVLDKTTNDTFESTNLAGLLEARGISKLVIAGLQSEFCIRATTLGALARGCEVTLVSDGHSTYDGKSLEAAEITASGNEELAERVTLVAADAVAFSG